MGGGTRPKDSASTEGSDESPSLTLDVLGDYMQIPSCESQVTVMARLRGSAQKKEESRAPITICAAIDCSGSMKDHLPLLKETLSFMIQQLRSEDKLSLVTFDKKVCIELPLTAMDMDGKRHAEKAVKRMKEGSQTNLSGGLLAALEVLYKIKSSDASLVESVLLFTDGKANVGIVDTPTIVKATKSVLGQIDRQACVFTFGFGSEHDADLLHEVAEAGNGLFYYIDNRDSIPESFCDCLGGLLSVVAQNVRLTLTAIGDSSMSRPLTTYKISEKEAQRCYQVTINDVYCEEERCILVTISVPAIPALTEPTTVSIVTCKVEFFDVALNKQSEGGAGFSLIRNRDLDKGLISEDYDDIELHRIRCETASTLEKANTLAKLVKIQAARELLQKVEVRIRRSVVAKKPLAIHLHQTVVASLSGLEDEETYVKHGKALMSNYADSHWKQRSNATPSEEGYIKAKSRVSGHTSALHLPHSEPNPPQMVSPYRNTCKSTLVSKQSSQK